MTKFCSVCDINYQQDHFFLSLSLCPLGCIFIKIVHTYARNLTVYISVLPSPAAFPVLSTLAASASADTTDLADDNGDVMPGLEIVTTYNIISEAIPPPLTSLTTLTTSSTLESVFNEPVMSVAVADCSDQADTEL